MISPPHLKQVIKSIEKIENKTPKQEENISLTDLTKPIPQDEVTQVKEKFPARSTTKEGAVSMIYHFSSYVFSYIFC